MARRSQPLFRRLDAGAAGVLHQRNGQPTQRSSGCRGLAAFQRGADLWGADDTGDGTQLGAVAGAGDTRRRGAITAFVCMRSRAPSILSAPMLIPRITMLRASISAPPSTASFPTWG